MRDASHVESKGCTSRRAARTQRSIGGRKKEELKEIYTYICVCVCVSTTRNGSSLRAGAFVIRLEPFLICWHAGISGVGISSGDQQQRAILFFFFFSSVSMRFDLNVFHFLCSLQMWCRTPRGRARRTRATRRWNWRRNSTSIAT